MLIKKFQKFVKLFLSIFLAFFTFSCAKNWSYQGKNAAQNWGSLSEEFKFCKIGYNQSPIDAKYGFEKNELKFSYQDSEVETLDKNYVRQIFFDNRDFVLRGKKKYFLRHLEFHHPSEHLVDSNQHSLEMQIYHKSEDEQLLVLAIFLEVGEENSAFNSIIKTLSKLENLPKINLAKIVKSDDKIFFYDGSITTPPCVEGVKWYIMKTPLKISKEQMNQIIKLAIFTKSNARIIQEFHPEKY